MVAKIPIVDGHAHCRKCGRTLPLSAFHTRADRPGKPQYPCKECRKLYLTDYYEAHSGRYRSRALGYRYGGRITQAEYEALLAQQGGGCAVCGQPETRKGGRHLAVDHDHETGEIRGLLCMRCNLALGRLRDDPSIWRKALAYLLQAEAEVAE